MPASIRLLLILVSQNFCGDFCNKIGPEQSICLVCPDVRSWGRSGYLMLTARFTALNPDRTSFSFCLDVGRLSNRHLDWTRVDTFGWAAQRRLQSLRHSGEALIGVGAEFLLLRRL